MTGRLLATARLVGTASLALCAAGCAERAADEATPEIAAPTPQFFLSTENTHNKFSSTIPPALRVPSGAVVQVETKEATDGQLTPDSTAEDVLALDFEPIHPLSGPIYVEGARPGDVLAVKLHRIEVGDWGWTAFTPGFGLLADEFPEAYIKTYRLAEGAGAARFSDRIEIPLSPFPGVMGVAPDTEELLSTIPPRANGGNMDNPYLTEGATVYFPVLVQGALFSIGDTHAAQGMGEVCGTAIEAPMTIVLELRVLQGGRSIPEPEYETEDFYAVTAFATTLDEAARKATRYMIDYLTHERGLDRSEAYVLCSVAGELKIAEVVDVPHVLVAMHMPKRVFLD